MSASSDAVLAHPKQPAEATEPPTAKLQAAAESKEPNGGVPPSQATAAGGEAQKILGSFSVATEVQSRLTTEHSAAESDFARNSASQGFIGRGFDFLKNNLGSTSEGRAWYNPKALWSNVLDYNSGSQAIGERVAATGRMLASAQTNLDKGDLTAFANTVQAAATVGADGTLHARTQDDARRYDTSQRNGVEVITDTAIMAGATLIPGGILGAAVYGGVAKFGLKYLDGNYYSGSDLFTGAFVGAGPLAGRAVGRTLGSVASQIGAETAPRTAAFVGGVLGYATESGTIGAMLNGSAQFGASMDAGEGIFGATKSSLSAAGSAFAIGFGAGAVLGAPLQLMRMRAAGAYQSNFETPRLGQQPDVLARQLNATWDNAVLSKNPDALKNGLNNILEKNGLPPLTNVKSTMDGKYFFGGDAGYVHTDTSLQLNNMNYRRFAPYAAHELTHHDQTYLVVRHVADQLGIGAEFTKQDLQKMWGKLAFKVSIDETAKESMLKFRAANGAVPLTPTEALRAEKVLSGMAGYHDLGNNIVTATYRYNTNFIEREAYRIQRWITNWAPYDTRGTRLIGLGTMAREKN